MFADENRVSIRLAKWVGKDKMNLLQNEEYGEQCLITALNKVLDRLDTENITQAKKTYPLRIEKRYVDKKALREAVINAFVHNDYSNSDTPIFEIYEDRFEITTYGDLLTWINKEDFYTGKSKPRNPEIMKIFRDLEFVEYLGSGIPYIVGLYGRDIFYFSKTATKIVLKFDKSIEKEVEKEAALKGNIESKDKTTLKTTQKIIEAIKQNPKVTTLELSALLDLTIDGIKWNLKKLKEENKIRRVGSKKDGYWEITE
jgi:predicted HTH transcriptional regulator